MYCFFSVGHAGLQDETDTKIAAEAVVAVAVVLE
jgi:hypothetical protein